MSQSIEIDLSSSFHPEWGITEEDCKQLHPRLLSVRDEMIQQDLDLLEKGEVPKSRSPLDGHFYLLPEKILSEYQADRSTSELAKILAAFASEICPGLFRLFTMLFFSQKRYAGISRSSRAIFGSSRYSEKSVRRYL